MRTYPKRIRDPRHDRQKQAVQAHILKLLKGSTEACPVTTGTMAAISQNAYSTTTFRVHLKILIEKGLVDRRDIGSDRNPCWAYWLKS